MKIKQSIHCFIAVIALLGANIACAGITIPVYLLAKAGQDKAIGTITLEAADNGVLVTPDLHSLPAGIHGFHVHVNPSCADHGMAAGGHFDPKKTDKHEGPYQHSGHLGDLPVLIVDDKGDATLPTFAPRLTLSQLAGHSIMIHAGGDNYSDAPEKLGGGGARIACGVVSE